MRFCPFCSAENQHESSECSSCGRRLPPLPPRRRKNGLERTAPVEIAKPQSLPRTAPTRAESQLETPKVAPAISARNKSLQLDVSEKVAAPADDRAAVPIPSRTERDRLASLSIGVAPVLANETGPALGDVDTSGGWPAPATSSAPDAEEWSLKSGASVSKEAARTASTPPPIPVLPSGTPAETIPQPDSSKADSPKQWPAPEQSLEQLQPFKAAEVMSIPGVPEAGLIAALKYTVAFGRARWQRRGAIKSLRSQIGLDTGVLDGILGTLGKQARSLKIENKALEAENRAIDEAENRRKTADHDCSGLSNRQAEENSKFADIEQERSRKVDESNRALDAAQGELGSLEAQKRGWKDKRKSIESRQKGYLKAADNRSSESEKKEISSERDELRHSAENLRADAAALEAECDDVDRCLKTLEGPISEKSSRVDALRSDLDAAKRALTDLREGHRHRLAEIDAEQGRKSRELAQAEAEIQRRHVTLGTIVNLNRIDRGEFADLYAQIDTLRGAIGARSNEIDKLSAERHAFDKASLVRGACVLGGIVVCTLALLAIVFTTG